MRSEIAGLQVAEARAFFGSLSKLSKRCHKNVIVLSDSEISQPYLVVAQADISGRES